MEDEFDADPDLLVALAASDAASSSRQQPTTRTSQPAAQRIEQPRPQRLDRPPPPADASASKSSASKVVQPTPQALPGRGSGSSILVSPRQKGNPVLACIRSLPWEYSDIPADYGLGLTTCALFLSLKYHRLHPEYIYTRIRNLQGKYNLRILLAMVDIPNHEDSLRELSKTSLVNNVTIILCWSAAEAARYLELYKSYEHANFAAIRGQQATSYAEKLVEFVTVPRSVNKADAVALVSTFGSLRSAINAAPEQISVISGWGERKVKNWCNVVEEPFRVRTAGRRRAAGVPRDPGADPALSRTAVQDEAVPIGGLPLQDAIAAPSAPGGADGPGQVAAIGPRQRPPKRHRLSDAAMEEDEEATAMAMATVQGSGRTEQQAVAQPREEDKEESSMSDGVAAALAKLRGSG